MNPLELSPSIRFWSTLAHLSALSLYLGVPFSNILVPFAIWSLKREESPFIEEQGREIVNFQLSVTLYVIGLGLLLLPCLGSPLFLLMALLIGAILIGNAVLIVMAAIATAKGEAFHYPLSIPFIQW